MQKKLEYILNKRLTVKGETLSVEKIRTLEHFLSYLRNVSIVFRCLGDDYLQKHYWYHLRIAATGATWAKGVL